MITYDETKRQLILNNPDRQIDLAKVAEMIERGEFLDRRPNPNYPDQEIYVILYHGYTCVVPFELREQNEIHLITAFPSRVYHKAYKHLF